MALSVAVAVLLLIGECATASRHDSIRVIFVNGQKGTNNELCVQGGHVDTPCLTLEYVAEQIANDSGPVKIVLLNPTLDLFHTINFSNIHHITIQGMDTLVSCGHGNGLIFQSVAGLEIHDLFFFGCGVEGPIGVNASIHVVNCTNVLADRVVVTRSKGVGMLFYDTFGKVSITESNFTENGNTSAEKYGNGMYIYFTHCPEEESRVNTSYWIDNCGFVNNSGYVMQSDRITEERFRMLQMGGGLGIQFRNDSCFNNVSITRSNFTGNSAWWGGGVVIRFKEEPRGNNVLVSGTHFVANTAGRGGGATTIGFYCNHNNTHLQNRVVFTKTTFYRNKATYGGATGIYAKHGPHRPEPGETAVFKNCRWLENIANFSPAVDITPYDLDTFGTGYLPIPVFTDCYFCSNTVAQFKVTLGTRNAAGAFLVTKFTVQFEGKLVFENHSYSPLQVVSGTINFQVGSSVLFQSNTGIQGGAIAMYGFASLNVKDNSSFRFINNTARDVGGAIYFQSLDQHDFVSSRTCFIQYGGSERNVQSRNLTMNFTGNTANRAGDSIFAASLYPCYYQYFADSSESTIDQSFQQIGKFHFSKKDKTAIATDGSNFQYENEETILSVIPGRKFQLPFGIRDELNATLTPLYRIDTTNGRNIAADRPFTANNEVRVYGSPYTNTSLEVYTVSFREIAISIQLSMLECPPGYFIYQHQVYTTSTCECAAYHEEHAYLGIKHCNKTLFRAYIEHGYWAGYTSSGHITPDGLHTALCPLGFCSYELESAGPLFLLPNISSREVLDDWMCGHYRTGVLCGKCDHDYSVYYHSHQYRCATSDNCRLGVLYYILSELLPLTILFTTVIVFDIRFTSGALNGFVFFSQVLDTLSIDARGAIEFPTGVDTLSIGYSVLYGLLNFDFLGIEQLSFCLWENATVLDVVAFKYVTVVYALILVVALVTLMRWCNCQQLCKIKRKISAKESVIHGLTTFLVMCYVQCTRVSFQILTAVTLTGKGGHSGLQVTFYGGLPYLGREHIAYAIPAFLCIATLVALPPILLLVFPLCNHILSWFGLSESTVYSRITRCLLVNQLKPILDSFQGCFKDKLRFFAGLYFVYRIAILVAYTFSRTALQFYLIVQVLIIFMLVVHATAQPYANRLHNIIDSLVLGNLALINAFTVYIFYHRLDSQVDAVFWIQLILIYLPVISMAVLIAGKTAQVFPKTKLFKTVFEACVNLSRDSSDSGFDHSHLPIPYQEFELSHRTRQTSPPDTRPDFGFDD